LEGLDYDASGIYEGFINDPDYKNSEQRFQAIQKEILDLENEISLLSIWLYKYVSELKPPVTRLIETAGFRTDKTLQAIEEAYYQKIGRDLRTDTLSTDWTPNKPSRVERLNTLKEGMVSEPNPNPNQIDVSILPLRSFIEVRERNRRSLEVELMEQVWKETFQNSTRGAKETVRKLFNKEEFKNIIKTVGEIDTLYGGWWPVFPKYFSGEIEFPEIENRLKDHIRPQVIQSMAGMMKDQIEEYASKLFQLDILLKYRKTVLNRLEESNQVLKTIEQKTEIPSIKIEKEIHPEGTKVKEVEIFTKAFPLVAGQSFELEAVIFHSNSFSLTQWAKFELDRIADILSKHPHLNFTIRVHTHPQMSVSFADELTVQRAEEIKKYFEERGIEDSRLKVIGFGKRNPLVLSQNQASKIRNQRVELFIEKS
jgi:outer membrane protein OmpA-like peptidoglycan-associated protein